MQTPSGKLIVDLSDSKTTVISSSYTPTSKSNIDENATTYKLYPLDINELPIITKNLYDASTPAILRSEASLDNKYNTNLYISADGIVNTVAGVSFTLRIEATQPNVLNVENGVPVIKQKTDDLVFNWLKDGVSMPDGTDYILDSDGANKTIEQAKSFISVRGNELRFINITTKAAATYVCEIKNDIGSVLSEAVNLLVVDPTSATSTMFFTNLVQNPFALNDVDGWSSSQGNIKTQEFLKSGEGEEPLQITLKRPENQIKGYIPDHFHPHPTNIKVQNIVGYDIYSISKGEAKYFTREDIQYLSRGGVRKVSVYQDVDLSSIADYISGGVYGVEGIKAFFGCYIGNALSKLFPTVETTPPSKRRGKFFYYQGAPRISVENFLRGGVMDSVESVEVVVQEYQDNKPLTSKIINSQGRVEEKDYVVLVDPITKRLKNLADNIDSAYPVDKYQVGYTLKSTDQENKILKLYEDLYGTYDKYYNNGEYVEYSTIYYSSLNKKTNKIRISLLFDILDDRLYEYIWFDQSADSLLDLQAFEYPTTVGTFRSQPRPQLDTTNRYYAILENSIDGQIAEQKGLSLKNVFGSGANSRGLVTGLNLSLHPITEKTKQFLGSTNESFVKKVIAIPTKEQDQKDRVDTTPIKPEIPFSLSGLRFERWKIIFEQNFPPTQYLVPQSIYTGTTGYAGETTQTKKYSGIAERKYTFKIKPLKYLESSQTWEEQQNFPQFSRSARALRQSSDRSSGAEFQGPASTGNIPQATLQSITNKIGNGFDWKTYFFRNSSYIGAAPAIGATDMKLRVVDTNKIYNSKTGPRKVVDPRVWFNFTKNHQPESIPDKVWEGVKKLTVGEVADLVNDSMGDVYNFGGVFLGVDVSILDDRKHKPYQMVIPTPRVFVSNNKAIQYSWQPNDISLDGGRSQVAGGVKYSGLYTQEELNTFNQDLLDAYTKTIQNMQYSYDYTFAFNTSDDNLDYGYKYVDLASMYRISTSDPNYLKPLENMVLDEGVVYVFEYEYVNVEYAKA